MSNEHSVIIDGANQIRLCVCEYLIVKKLKPSKDVLLFVSLDKQSLQQLTPIFPTYRFREESEAEITTDREVVDKKTKERGILIEVKSVTMTAQGANVVAGYFAGSGTTYTFELQKYQKWRVTNVRNGIVGD